MYAYVCIYIYSIDMCIRIIANIKTILMIVMVYYLELTALNVYHNP